MNLKQRQFGTNVRINLIITFVTNVMICNKCNDEVIVLGVFFWQSSAGGVRLKVNGEECAAGSRGRAAKGGQGEPHGAVGFLALG